MATRGRTAVDSVRDNAHSAAQSGRVTVLADSDVQGVRLGARPVDQPAGDPDEIQSLLDRFSPEYVIFPDATPGTRRPSGGGKEDYHPRTVEAYVDHVRPYIASPSGWLAGLYVAAAAALMGLLGAMWVSYLVGHPFNEAVYSAAFLLALLLIIVAFILYAQARTMSNVRRLIRRTADAADPPKVDPTERLGMRAMWLELPAIDRRRFLDWSWANRAWAQYQRDVIGNARYARTIYCRAVEAGDELYLQYWPFYVFNDWHNKHEADWEVAVVRLAKRGSDWDAIGAAYSSHFGGHWRPRGDVQWRGSHPVVYVAHGSHAQYFASKEGGYTATLSQSFGFLDLRIGRRDWKDVVALDPGPSAPLEHYQLVPLPVVHPQAPWSDEDFERFWWLRYAGLWGGSGAINGPRQQGSKWTDPAAWVGKDLQRDSSPWSSLTLEGGSGADI